MFNVTTRHILCPACQRPAQAVTLLGRELVECDPCADAEKARRNAEQRQQKALSAWVANTPLDMQAKLDPSKLHPALLPALETDGRAGCALIGASDAGKTRIGYHLLRKAALVGIPGMAVTHAEIRRAASNLNASDPKRSDAAHTLLNVCRHTACLLIDDIGKGSSTPVGDETFFDLLTHRRDCRMLTHWTANAGSEWLAKRFGEDKGRPILLRLSRLTDGHIYVAE